MKINKKKLGFTLVELLVVIAILAVLATVAIIGYSSFINEAHKSNDNSVVTELNHYLKAANPLDEEVPTATDAAEKLEGCGLNIAELQPSAKDAYYGYNYEKAEFVYVEKENAKISDDNITTFLFVKDSNQKAFADQYHYSVYLQKGYSAQGTFEADYGLDVGEATVTDILYDTNLGKTVVIRTNSASTTLTINAELDTIHHYDTLGALNIIKANTASYHENGNVAYAEIAYGRIVLESGSKVEEIHVNKKTDSSFDTVIIANNGGAEELPDRITRDAVTVAAETLVVKVESNGSSENVYVYADGATGTKGSTQKITEGENKQNENVNSALGQLVLDNGATADKAQTAEEKAEAKDEAASEAVSANFTSQEGNSNYVARIGQTGYMSLQDAVDAAVNGNTIALLKDVTLLNGESIIINKDITLNLGGKTISGSKDPMIVIGSKVAQWDASGNNLTHTGHLTIRGEGTINNSDWDMFDVFADATLDIYGGTFVGFKSMIRVRGGTFNSYGGNYSVTAVDGSKAANNYIICVELQGVANIYAGNYTTPDYGCYGVYLTTASVVNFGSNNSEGPTFNTWRACISSNGSESHEVLINVYSGKFTSRRDDGGHSEETVIQLANNTVETQTLNIYGGTFEQAGSCSDRSIFNVRYNGTININISGGKFIVPADSSGFFSGVCSENGTSTPTTDNVHVVVTNNIIPSGTQNVKVYKYTSGNRAPEKDFELVIE
jgi:prepilin-type N-terminal cleavage/methylation domain-containing protein